MSASPPNLAALPAPGPSAGASAAASGAKTAAKDPVAGFEALLASFFGTEGQTDPAADPAKAATKDLAGAVAQVSGSGDDSTSGVAPATTEPATFADSLSAEAMLASLVQPQPVATPHLTTTASADADATLGGGTWRTKSAAPAIPILTPSTASLAGVDGETPAGVASAAAQAATDAAAGATSETPTPKLETPASPKVATEQTPAQQAAPTPAPVAAPTVTSPNAAQAAAAVATIATPASAAEAKAALDLAPIAAAPKEKAPAGKSPRTDTPRIDAAAPAAAKTGDAALESVGPAPDTGPGDSDLQTADAMAQPAEHNTGPTDSSDSTSSTITPATLTHAAAAGVRGSPQTVANLAAQIARKLEGRLSRFDLQLDPIGLGRVDVRMEIGASGRMTAAMTFETPQAAAELRARASDLQRQLEQAGFDLSGGMTFDVAGDRGQGRHAQHQDNEAGQAFRGRAFQSALATAGEAAQSAQTGALNPRRRALSSVDIRI